jgi:hypothetical protein
MFEIYKRIIAGDFYIVGGGEEDSYYENLKKLVMNGLQKSKLFWLDKYIPINKSSQCDTLFSPYPFVYVEFGEIDKFPIKHKTQKGCAYWFCFSELKGVNLTKYKEEYPELAMKISKLSDDDLFLEAIEFHDLDNDIVCDFLHCFVTAKGNLENICWQSNNSWAEIEIKKLEALFSFLRLINLGNIKIQSEEIERKTKIHLKKNKSNQTHYHILTVTKPSIQKKSEKNNGEKKESALPLHQVRGHLADYTQGNGLFGKYNIRLWIPDHWRGDIQYGKVSKDYKLKISERLIN